MKDSVAVEKGAGKAKKSHQHRSHHKNLFLMSLSFHIFTQPRKDPEKLPTQILPQKLLSDIFESVGIKFSFLPPGSVSKNIIPKGSIS